MMAITTSGADCDRLGRKLERLVGSRVGVACSAITAAASDLYPEELSAVRQAVAKRRREFATGRVNARQAMSRIGESTGPIPSGPDRAPIWPAHLSGSISHTDSICVAMVARRSDTASLGVDVENDNPMTPDLWSSICTPAEAAHVASLAAENRGRWVTSLFSAKEAVYKWQYPLTGRMLDFQQVQLTWQHDEIGAHFLAQLDVVPALRPPAGRWCWDAGLVMSWVCAA
jgi:4'-phosphopantetheinyl transferase EntD